VTGVADIPGAWENLDLEARRALLGAVIERVAVAPANGNRQFNPDRVDITWRV
jgi:hypothetical protein